MADQYIIEVVEKLDPLGKKQYRSLWWVRLEDGTEALGFVRQYATHLSKQEATAKAREWTEAMRAKYGDRNPYRFEVVAV